MKSQFISISFPPFPDFIEGNKRIFQAGQYHPDRTNLGYFDLIFVKKGVLFLREEDVDYEVKTNEMFVLLPDKRHYSWQACQEETEFYWLHFYTTSPWKQCSQPSRFVSELPIPDLHYHQKSYTLHLRKQAVIKEPEILFALIQEILDSTVSDDPNSIWHTEELFLRFLKFVENQGIYKDRLSMLAVKVQLFLENHYNESVTNTTLEEKFSLHRNYISTAMKTVYEKTALELLEEIRIDKAKQFLLQTDLTIQEIATLVGYNSDSYFSNCFKKLETVSPRAFRKKYFEKL